MLVGRRRRFSASLPPWRRCLGSSCRWWSPALFGEDPCLRLPSLSFLYIVQVALVVGWRLLCRCTALADALPPSSLVEILFWRMLCRRCRLVRWMLCHLFCVVDLHILGGVVFFSRFSYVVLARCLEFGSVSSSVVLAWSSATFLVVLCVRLNSLCLLRFVMVVLLSS